MLELLQKVIVLAEGTIIAWCRSATALWSSHYSLAKLTLFLWYMQLLPRVYHVAFYIDEDIHYNCLTCSVYLTCCDPVAILFLVCLT